MTKSMAPIADLFCMESLLPTRWLGDRLRLVVCDFSTSPAVDLAGARMFLELYTELAKHGIILPLVEAHASVRDPLRMEGAEDRVGRIDRFETVADVIEHFQKNAT